MSSNPSEAPTGRPHETPVQATPEACPLRADVGPARRGALLEWAVWFCLLNIPALWLLGGRYVFISGVPPEWPARAFLALACGQHFFLLAMAPWVIVALAVLLLPRPRVATVAAVFSGFLLLGVISADLIVLKMFRFHLNGMVWSLLVNGGVDEIITLSWNTYLTIFLGAVAILALEAGVAWLAWRLFSSVKKKFWRVALLSGCALTLLMNLSYAMAHALHYTPVTSLQRVLPAFRPVTANKMLKRMGFPVRARPADANIRFSSRVTRYPLEPLLCANTNSMNVVLIVIDGWRNDMLTPKAAPNIDAFAQANLRFTNHSAAARCTRFGIFSLFYGICGTYWDAMLLEQRGPVLIDELKRRNYHLGLFGSASLSNPEFDRTVFSAVRESIPEHKPLPTAVLRDQAITSAMLHFLKSRDTARPFLGFVFYDATHAYSYPSDAPAPFQPACASVDHLKFDNDTDPVPLKNRYLNAVNFVDSLVEQVLRELESEKLLDNTIVVITGDHGEEFNETGKNYWGHGSNFTPYQTRVPFVVHWPGKNPAVLGHPTSHLDLVPTLVHDMLGSEQSIKIYSNGMNLFDTTPRLPLVVSSWKCLAMTSPGRIDVLYDNGFNEHYDEQCRELKTAVPANLLRATLEATSRFAK